MMQIINVILSGGVGSRLWPLSRKLRPKQYLDIFEEQSLFGLTVNRNIKLVDSLMIISNENNSELGKKWLENIEIPISSIVESLPRNTGAAIALACFAVQEDDILLITPSDHVINDDENYKNAINNAITLANDDYLVTFGITPKRPDTGFGYIEHNGNDVLSFREKPNIETAIEFVNSGKFMWNSGMFCFKAKVLLQELSIHDPELYTAAKNAWENRNSNNQIDEGFMRLIPSKSIDYAVMEKSSKIKMVKSDFAWSDLGAFDSLYDYLITQNYPIDENGNMSIGNKKMYTHFLGLKNSILVYTDDAILVLNKDNAQEVKNIYEQLEKYNINLI